VHRAFGSCIAIQIEEGRAALRKFHLKGSMRRDGTCADNAATESFFALLQKEVLD
jgi:transposase InsO family protein